MKVISSELGQVFQRFAPDEVRSERDIYIPQLYALARERYGFTNASEISVAREQGAKFQFGRMEVDGRQIVILSLEVYSDGLIVKCRNTDDTDVVLDDALEWGIQTFGLRRPKTIFPRIYQSHLVVDFEGGPAKAIRRFDAATKLMTAAFERDNPHLRGRMDFLRLGFAIDPKTLPPHASTVFAFERRAGADYEWERYFCSSPIRTQEHIQLLEDLERLWGT